MAILEPRPFASQLFSSELPDPSRHWKWRLKLKFGNLTKLFTKKSSSISKDVSTRELPLIEGILSIITIIILLCHNKCFLLVCASVLVFFLCGQYTYFWNTLYYCFVDSVILSNRRNYRYRLVYVESFLLAL